MVKALKIICVWDQMLKKIRVGQLEVNLEKKIIDELILDGP